MAKRCSRCGGYPCRCPKPKSFPPEQQTACIRREKKHRGGKTVTVIMELQLTPDDKKALAKKLKKKCGTGGTVTDGNIEIQGDHREKVAAELLERLAKGESVALVCDAGTPLISDPGYRLVAAARDAGIDAFFGKSDFREGGLAETLRELIAARRSREQSA